MRRKPQISYEKAASGEIAAVILEWKGKRVTVFFDKEDEYAIFVGQPGMGTMVTTSCPPDGKVSIWPHW